MSAWADNPQAAQIDALIERANRLMQDEKNALIDSFWWLDRISLGALYDELWGVATTAIEMAGRGVDLVKSKQRVADHGEVFTPSWLVEDMLDLVKHEAERIDSRFLEPACGSGNFVIPVLRRKLATVHARYGKSDFEKRHHALFALMCIYGIELLDDNVAECRQNLLDTLFEYLGSGSPDEWFAAARVVVDANIVQGDAMAMTSPTGEPIVFPEWAYLGRGKFQRRDFRFEHLTQRSSIKGSLFEMLDEHDVFQPVHNYPPRLVKDLAS